VENRVRKRGEERYGLGGVGRSPEGLWWWWWRIMSPCASLMILPFGEVSENFNQWVL